MITAVTTFNAAGLELYGRRMVETFNRFWPEDVGLTVYTEGWEEDCGRGRLLALEDAAPWLLEFKSRHVGRRFKDYRWDAVRFAHKVAAVCHAARRGSDYLIWLDGDIVTHAAPDVGSLLPAQDEWIAWLDRERMYPECGLFVLNCRHKMHDEMICRLLEMYIDDALFRLLEWHDSFVLEHVVKRSGVKAKSLSGYGQKTSHPLVNSEITSQFFDHCKGPRKLAGRTPVGERQIRDSVPYWAS